MNLNALPAKLFILNFHPHKVVSLRGRPTAIHNLQVGKNYSYLLFDLPVKRVVMIIVVL